MTEAERKDQGPGAGGKKAASPSGADKMKGILTDVTKCIGCERCVEACCEVNRLGTDFPAHYKAGDGLSEDRFTAIVKVEGPAPGTWRTVRRQCMHCLDPSCQAACLVGAFKKLPGGPVVYDDSKCIGCRYCMLACPFMIPRYEYDQPVPYVRKCKMNEECRMEGGMPACVTACPTGATIFGPREALLKEARRRITEHPGRYVDHVYGEHEFGGTSVIYLSDVPLNEVLRMPTADALEKRGVGALAEESIPELNHPWVLVTPVQFLTVTGLLWGAWFLRRRSNVQYEEALERRARNEKKA